jgi:DNA ligase-1
MTLMPILYKRTSTGAIQTWQRELDGNRYRSISGQLDGAKVESGWTVCDGKNKGRSNETSGEQQAQLECDAAYVKKQAQGKYHARIEDIDEVKFFAPMLAQDFKKFPVTTFSDVWSQPKLDGVRCIVTRDGMFTRQGKPIEACPHIFEALAELFDIDPDLVFDGELYTDKLSDDFNEIISLVRKKGPDAARLKRAKDMIEYHVYDLPSHPGGFEARSDELFRLINKYLPEGVIPVATTQVTNAVDMDSMYSLYMEQGYEGQMIRVGTNPYENKRSRQLLKRKEFNDDEFEIVAIFEGAGNRTGMAGYITYKLPDGREFGSGIKGTHDYCRQLLADADKYVGGTGTVQFFNLTPDGIPRFPVTLAVYEGERDV